MFRGILNVFVVYIYDYTNDKMFTHCYKSRNSKQFLDFIGRVDSLYDSTIKKIFLVLDNISIHRSKKVRQILLLHHPRIIPIFLPTKSPDLNLIIEVRWTWLQRKAINNSTFKSESDIGKVVQDWTTNYNQTHMKTIANILHKGLIYSFT
jgi:transposase